MALQDLTPQLRTRLGRLERLVGVFVTVATLLMACGFAYYLYQTAQRKGWFLTKAPYFTYLRSGAGLKVGDPVRLMGFDAGEITRIAPEDPGKPYDVYVEFLIRAPNYGYVWSDTKVKVNSAGLLGNRYLEITKGGLSGKKVEATYKEQNGRLTEIYSGRDGVFTNYTKGSKPYFLLAEEAADVAGQVDQIIQVAKNALPNILALTNLIGRVLGETGDAAARLDELLADAGPLLTNLNAISAQLREPKGSLGEWLLPVALNQQLSQTLTSANTALVSANTAVTNTDQQLFLVASNLTLALENLAGITSNLNAQVQANTNLVSSVNHAIRDADDLVQGLKRHWLLRSAFKTKETNEPTPRTRQPARPPRWP